MAGTVSSLLSFTLLLLLLQFNFNSAQTFIYLFCYDYYNPITDTTYEANLNHLLSSFSTNTTANNSRFYTNMVGTSPDKLYGVFQCRGDLAPEDCKKCAQTASIDMKVRCPYRKRIFIWYDECWLHYSNNHSRSTMLSQPTDHFNWGNNVSNPEQFMQKVNELLNGLVAEAVDHESSSNMYALDTINVTNSQTIYGLVQCTQDISRRDCDRCLKEALGEILSCCGPKDALRVLKPSCIAWYEVYNFVETGFFTGADPPLINRKINQGQHISSTVVIIVVVLTVNGGVFLSLMIFFYLRRRRKGGLFQLVEEDVESLKFKFGTLVAATNNFDEANKLGEGGFGAVYKGTLLDERKIAVKRLAQNSVQGVKEFTNEILLVAKIQHRNIVRLLGFCLEGNEKLFIYEYVPNASLDRFLFDPIKSIFLDWERRYNIIEGIARGILYLHEGAPDRIVHRDLKASNILLDAEMNPKISDFAMARLFMVQDQTHGSTSKVVGTHASGYMAPEYAMHGHFSVKSDVFSFGVLVLEILSGEQNSCFSRGEDGQDLLSYAWKHWEQGTLLELLEPTLRQNYSRNQVMRCIHVGLLCVQQDVASRPTMASIVLMFDCYSVTLPLPSAAPARLLGNAKVFKMLEEDQQRH